MRMILYAGPAVARDATIDYAGPIIRRAASAVTLLTGGGQANLPLLEEALQRLELPDDLPRNLRSYSGDALDALSRESARHGGDLAIVGRLQPALKRLIYGPRSKQIAQRLSLAVLRVQGRVGPIHRILLASGGDPGTIENARQVGRLAAALGASVTILHVLSQQPLVFTGLGGAQPEVAELVRQVPEAEVLQEASELIGGLGVATALVGRSGPVVDAVVEEARDHDLLAIGAHRAGRGLDRILLEDLAGDILDLSPIPVLVGRW